MRSSSQDNVEEPQKRRQAQGKTSGPYAMCYESMDKKHPEQEDPQRQTETSGSGGSGGKGGDAHGARISFPRDDRVLSLLVVMAAQL